ncbi:MAG: hypothetical protein AVDCRST_MAG01-01-2217, partial [uncultured Rubrobacteraceae bacterium]
PGMRSGRRRDGGRPDGSSAGHGALRRGPRRPHRDGDHRGEPGGGRPGGRGRPPLPPAPGHLYREHLPGPFAPRRDPAPGPRRVSSAGTALRRGSCGFQARADSRGGGRGRGARPHPDAAAGRRGHRVAPRVGAGAALRHGRRAGEGVQPPRPGLGGWDHRPRPLRRVLRDAPPARRGRRDRKRHPDAGLGRGGLPPRKDLPLRPHHRDLRGRPRRHGDPALRDRRDGRGPRGRRLHPPVPPERHDRRRPPAGRRAL